MQLFVINLHDFYYHSTTIDQFYFYLKSLGFISDKNLVINLYDRENYNYNQKNQYKNKVNLIINIYNQPV